MFLELLIVTFVVSTFISTITAFLFFKAVKKVMTKLVSEDLAPIWQRFVLFAIYVVGISGGVRLWDIERYVTPDKDGVILQLNHDRWVIEIYKTIIGSLQSIAWMLLIFFLFALIAYVVVKGFEMKRGAEKSEK
jgi:hypothetical protein